MGKCMEIVATEYAEQAVEVERENERLSRLVDAMQVIRNIKTPTGNICILEGEKGKLEFLSLGDYGQVNNVKADFLGLTKDINGVPNGL